MAIAFELVINFGLNQAAAGVAQHFTVNHPPLMTGQHHVALHEPLVTKVRGYDGEPYLEMSIIPVGVGWGVGFDRHHERRQLTAAELTELGEGLYQLLAQLTGYRAAQVGWDPEERVDPAGLRQDWADELAIGDLPGLVLAEDLHRDLRGQGFQPFAPGFVWIPYQGERPSSLTADGHDV